MLEKQQLRHLANLARIGLSDEELEKLLNDLNNILGYIDEMNKLDLEKYEPIKNGLLQKLLLREDEVKQCPDEVRDQILKAFPYREGDWLKTPKILEKE